MNAHVGRTIEMGRRVRDFLRAHPHEVTSGAMLDRLERQLARAERFMAQQEGGLLDRTVSTETRNKVRHEMAGILLRALVAAGVVAAEDTPALTAQFKLPRVRARNQTFVIAARRMLARAVEHRDRLVAEGVPPRLFDELGEALARLEGTLSDGDGARAAHVSATRGLDVVRAEIAAHVRHLDGLQRYVLRDRPDLLAAWNSARNLVGPARARAREVGSIESAPGSFIGLAPAAAAASGQLQVLRPHRRPGLEPLHQVQQPVSLPRLIPS